ncbi:MAG: hypothetical protein NVSMB42_22620 [Herpetosiphon sp.]
MSLRTSQLRQLAVIVIGFALTLVLTIPAGATPTPVLLPGEPIWTTNGSAIPNSVVLFRAPFDLAQGISDVNLVIFADTRYEALLDGKWLGRGPARFSHVRQEFDTLTAPGLAPGRHVLSVLVQFAPNIRRSETLGAGL